MRYADGHNEATRERILEAASRLFQEHGIAAVGLARIMAAANLTVGAFYTHFESKEALLRESLLRALQSRNARLEQALRAGHLEGAIRAYLSPEHRDAPETGCPIAAVGPEVARHPRSTRRTFASQLEPSLELLAECLSTRRGRKVGRADAAALLGLLVGTLQLARATPDRVESGAILDAGVRAALRLANRDRAASPAPRHRANGR
jgi:AcrR family transcriptional regulator